MNTLLEFPEQVNVSEFLIQINEIVLDTEVTVIHSPRALDGLPADG